jgi:hypothetical protein
MKQLVAGIVGPEAAASFYGFLKDRSFKIPETDKILNSFEEARADVIELINANRLDVLSLVIKKLVLEFMPEASQVANLNSFVNCLPEELGVLLFKHMAAKRPEEFMETMEHFDAFSRISGKIFDMLKS